MEIELKEIRDFIAVLPPFNRLPENVVDEVTRKITIHYVRDGKPLPIEGETEPHLYIIRKGLISIRATDRELMAHLGECDICTMFCVESGKKKFDAIADEDTLIYSVPCVELTKIVRDYPAIIVSFMQSSAARRLQSAVTSIRKKTAAASALMHTSVKDIMASPVATVPTESTIAQAAKIMTERGISCVMVENREEIVGILTMKDITKRCVATEMPANSSVTQIMTSNMLGIGEETFAYDALMIMTRRGVSHLPVMEDGKLLGMVTSGDLIRHEGRNSAYLTAAIQKAKNISSLMESSNAVPQLQLQLVNMGATADHVGKGVTAITSAITRRLIELAIANQGPPPVPFAWVAAGSQSRREQTSHTDQDNGIVLHNDVTEADIPYFQTLAKFVCDGLAECGYIYCPGNIMATNPEWCQTQNVWAGYFHNWMSSPKPEALLHSSIFFDLRAIYGDHALLDEIRLTMLETSKESSMFLAHLTSNAVKLKPPLGFIRDFVLVQDGEHNDTLDLKHNGLAPIVDLARIYALAEGIESVNTIERLKQASGTRSLSSEGGANLLDAFEFIGSLRVEHQAQQIREGVTIDNFMSPKVLSRLEREHLKDAFKVIQTMQNSLESKFRG